MQLKEKKLIILLISRACWFFPSTVCYYKMIKLLIFIVLSYGSLVGVDTHPWLFCIHAMLTARRMQLTEKKNYLQFS